MLKALALFVLLLALQAPVSDEAKTEPGSIVYQGQKRTYQLFNPKTARRPALVIMLHGGGGNSANAIMMSQFNTLAAKEGFIVAYPDGSGRLYPNLLTWNAGHCCAFAMQTKVDDVGFMSALIDKLIAERKVDPRRVYVTGMSNGGMMSHRLAIELSDKIAAAAPVVGALFGDEPQPKAPTPMLMIVGAEDRVVPGAGGRLRVAEETGGALAARGPAEDRAVISSAAAADYWAKANGCRAARTTQTAAARRTTWSRCKADVEMYLVANNGHAWPGGRAGRAQANQPTKDFDASMVIWAFFKAHPKRG